MISSAVRVDIRASHDLKTRGRRPIDHFIVDFYCPKLKLVIEIDGESHNSKQAQIYDAERTKRLEGYGLKVIRFTNEEVLTNFEGVCDVIGGEILLNPQSLRLRHLP